MRWIQWNDTFEFAERVMPRLLKEEAKHSLMIGVLDNVKQGVYQTYHQFTVEEDGEILAILQVTPPHPLHYIVLSQEKQDEIAHFVIPHLIENKTPFIDIVSEKEQAERFGAAWQEVTHQSTEPFMAQRLYRLDTVNDVEMANGRMRLATHDDQPQLEAWYHAFEKESGLRDSTPEKVTRAVTMMIENEDAFLWEVDGNVVSCAKKSRPTLNGTTVSFVYTSPDARGQGYARSLVAELSRHLLETKSFCTLYTDLTNPTSNKIYQEVGYYPIMNSTWIRLSR